MPDCIYCLLMGLAKTMRESGPEAAFGPYLDPDQKAAFLELLRERPPELQRVANTVKQVPQRGDFVDETLVSILVAVAVAEGPDVMLASFCPQHRVLFSAYRSSTRILERRAETLRQRKVN